MDIRTYLRNQRASYRWPRTLTAQCNRDYIAACRQASNYDAYEICLERGPHGFGHRGIGAGSGAEMSDAAASPSDPIFFMHHSFIDQSWRIWQNDNANRIYDIASPTSQDGTGVLTLDYVLTSRGLRPDVRSLGDGVHEARIGYGPGYRVYFGNDGTELVILVLCGDKRTQDEDIATARKHWAE